MTEAELKSFKQRLRNNLRAQREHDAFHRALPEILRIKRVCEERGKSHNYNEILRRYRGY